MNRMVKLRTLGFLRHFLLSAIAWQMSLVFLQTQSAHAVANRERNKSKASQGSSVNWAKNDFAPIKPTSKYADGTAASSHRWDLSVGVPNLIEARLKTSLSENDFLGVSLGYFPLYLALPKEQREIHQTFNDRFDALIIPRANTFSTSLFYQKYFGKRFFVEPQLSLFVLNAGGQLYLQDPKTKLSTQMADFDFTLYQGLLSVIGGYSWGDHQQASRLEVGGGVSFVIHTAIQTQVRGMLPGFLAVAPEYKESFVDGTVNLESDLMDAIKRSDIYKRLWPSLFVRWSW